MSIVSDVVVVIFYFFCKRDIFLNGKNFVKRQNDTKHKFLFCHFDVGLVIFQLEVPVSVVMYSSVNLRFRLII